MINSISADHALHIVSVKLFYHGVCDCKFCQAFRSLCWV